MIDRQFVVRPRGLLTFQFPGNGPQSEYLQRDDAEKAVRELAGTHGYSDAERGTFQWSDGRVVVEANEALLEHIDGKRVEYAPPRYRDPIAIAGSKVPWVRYGDVSGAQAKYFGSFNEYGLDVKLLGLAAGTTRPPGRADAQIEVVVIEGSVRYDGQNFSDGSLLYGESGTDCDAIEALTDAQLLSSGSGACPLQSCRQAEPRLRAHRARCRSCVRAGRCRRLSSRCHWAETTGLIPAVRRAWGDRHPVLSVLSRSTRGMCRSGVANNRRR